MCFGGGFTELDEDELDEDDEVGSAEELDDGRIGGWIGADDDDEDELCGFCMMILWFTAA